MAICRRKAKLVRHSENLEMQGKFVKKMILIGESGSGKTDLLNLIKNYERLHDKDFQVSEIHYFVKPRVGGPMTSDTTSCSTHRVDIGAFMIDIIDTPGLADTRGKEQNKKNIDNIIAALKEANYVNCVCLVINGTQSRKNSIMATVLNEVKRTLSPDILDNFIVVLTKFTDIYDLCFHVSILQDFGISTNSESTFMINNAYSRWCNAHKYKQSRHSTVVKSEFSAAFKTLNKMMFTIKYFPPIKTCEFGNFEEIVQDVDDCFVAIRLNLEYGMDLKKVREEIKEIMEHQIGKVEKQLSLPSVKFHQWWTYFLESPEEKDSLEDEKKHCESILKKQEEEIAKIEKRNNDGIEALFIKLDNFKKMGSNPFYFKNAIEIIETWRKEVRRMPEFNRQQEILERLTMTIRE